MTLLAPAAVVLVELKRAAVGVLAETPAKDFRMKARANIVVRVEIEY